MRALLVHCPRVKSFKGSGQISFCESFINEGRGGFGAPKNLKMGFVALKTRPYKRKVTNNFRNVSSEGRVQRYRKVPKQTFFGPLP